jgi:hypothetical protein
MGIHTSQWSLQIPGSQHPLNLLQTEFEDVDWINFAQLRDYWQALLNTITNIRVEGEELFDQLSDYSLL